MNISNEARPAIISRTAPSIARAIRAVVAMGFSILGCLLFVGETSAFAAPPEMAIAGQSGVNSSGAFTYSIPITVPPGTRGMVPAISLNYSSQGGDGIVGLGWAIGGLSSITRCPQTMKQDSIHGSVNYDMNDRYCLDGERLILASGTGSYGSPGSQYHTEIESFRQITASGTAGNGPQSFEVQLPNGQVLLYGSSTDSRILAVGTTTVRVWALKQVTDTVGNYYTYYYNNDTTHGQYYPIEIDYTGNSSASLTPYNSVQFCYSTRPSTDIVPFYQAGSLQETTVLLKDIKTYNATSGGTGSCGSTSLILDYNLTYTPASSGASHDELNEITQCDGTGANCLAPTRLTWQGSRDTLTVTSASNSLAQGYGLLAGDFNGDGLTDALVLNASPSCPTNGSLYLGSLSGTFTQAPTLTASYTYYEEYVGAIPQSGAYCFPSAAGSVTVGDTTGAGISAGVINSVYWYQSGMIWLSTPYANSLLNDGTGNLTQYSSGTSVPNFLLFGDFNGDGCIDGVDANGNFEINGYATTECNGSFSSPSAATVGPSTNLVGDFDGDGCADVFAETSTGATVYYSSVPYPTSKQYCQPAVASSTLSYPSGSQVVLGDFNGDGKTDVLVVTSSGATLYLSTGTGFTSGYSISGSSTWSNYTIVTGDWNGDGKTDIALISSGGNHLFYLSTGTNFEQEATITNSATGVTAVVADWNNDGADDIWLKQSAGDTLNTFAYVPELMNVVNNGIGVATAVTYNRLNKGGTFYSKGSVATYPQSVLIGPYYVAYEISTTNGIGGTYNKFYSYSGALGDWSVRYPNPGPKSNLLTTPFQTFTTIAAYDPQTGLTRTDQYELTYSMFGLRNNWTIANGSTTLKQVLNTNTSDNLGGGTGGGQAYYYNTLTDRLVTSSDLNGSGLPTIYDEYYYDTFGNLTSKEVYVNEALYQTVTNTYNNDTTDWFLGQLTEKQIENTVNSGASDLKRTWTFSYNSNNLLANAIIEPDNETLKVTDYIDYDSYGNRNRSTLVGSGITSRSSEVTYDSQGEFPITATNALTQSDHYIYYASFGEPLTHTDPNSIVSSASYDTLGRATGMVRPDGNQVAISYAYCSGVNGGTASCPTYGAYLMQSTPETGGTSPTQNGAQTITYYDALGRVIATDVQSFNGCWSRVATQYNADLQVAQASRPYFTGVPSTCTAGTAYFTSYMRDAFGRVTQATFPDSSKTTYSYNNLTTTVTNDKGEVTTTVRTAQGPVASVTDANGNMTNYTYDAFGNLLSTQDASGNVINNTFDLRGRKTATSDPDMGSWSYTYDVLSELTSQADAKSQTTSLTYDLLGRVTERAEPGMTSCWLYDTVLIGSLTSASTYSGSACSGTATYSRTYAYDTDGRPKQTTLAMGGNTYVYNTGYDGNGRMANVTYPSGYTADYDYTSLGYLSQIVDSESGTAYWTANARDAELHLTQSTAGNGVVSYQSFNVETGTLSSICATPNTGLCDGVTASFNYDWDTIGRLSDRTDNDESYTEFFCYDSLDRVTNYAIGTSCTSASSGYTAKSVGYDALGDITSKSDLATTYSYPPSGPTSVRPHAVSSITSASGTTYLGLTSPKFAYDLDGNMTCVSTGTNCSGTVGRNVTYTSYNMTASLTQGTTLLCWTYDSEHNRISQVATTTANTCASPGSSAATTTYVNDPISGGMEEVYASGSTTNWRDYVIAEGSVVALRTITPLGTPTLWGSANWLSFDWTNSTPTVTYFNGDHLGSTSVLTNTAAAVTERDSYDAWGKRRNANGTDVSSCSISSATTRGYTGQEMLDSVCEINLNARLYDPVLARIGSPDPTVPNPLNGQSYNRYSYVNNGPLSAIDPSGFDGSNNDGMESGILIKPIDPGELEASTPTLDVQCIGCNVSGTGSMLGGSDTWDDSNAGATMSMGGIIGVSTLAAGAGGFCNNSGCQPGVSTEYSGGGSLQTNDNSFNSNQDDIGPIASTNTNGTMKTVVETVTEGDQSTTTSYSFPSSNNDGTVTAYLWYYFAYPGSFGGFYHAYLEIRNSYGGHFYLSGGPGIKNGGGGNVPLFILFALYGDAAMDPIFGSLEAFALPTTSSATFSQALGQHDAPLGTVNMTWAAAVGVLQSEANTVNDAGLTYDPLHANSNSVAFSGARALGFNPPQPNGLIFPAWNAYIPPSGH